jgi:hypothetical protein
MVDLSRLPRSALEAMDAHGRALLACQSAFAATGSSPLAVVLAGADAVYEWQHYPADDLYDAAAHAQYFYHAHPPGERKPPGRGVAEGTPEHGHFHTFLRARGMPPGVRPMVMPELAIANNPAAPKAPLMPSAPQQMAGEEGDPWSHLVAVAMDASGKPLRFFTTNRWVTDETWYAAADVAAMLERFVLGATGPLPLLDRWLMALLGLYRPLLGNLVMQRDAAIMDWRRRRRAKVHVFEDRRLEVTSSLEIDLERHLGSIAAALRRVA